jgi:hypothetical protein
MGRAPSAFLAARRRRWKAIAPEGRADQELIGR